MKDELVDILDEDMNQTGKALMKSEAHKKGLWHGGAHLWIYNSKDEVLLQKRSDQKEIYPSRWDVSVAGHIDAGETPRQAVLREAKEELNLSIDPDALQYIGLDIFNEQIPQSFVHRVVNWVYIIKLDVDLKSLEIEPEEVSEIKWIVLDDFASEVNDPNTFKNYFPSAESSYDTVIEEIQKKVKAKQ